MPPNAASPRPPPRLGQVRPDRDGHAPPPQRTLAAGAYRQASMYHYSVDASLDHPPRRGGRTMVYAFLGVVGLLALGLGALVAAPPVDLVRAHVAAAVERQTGRKLVIEAAGVSFASGLGVSLGKVTLTAPPTMAGAPLFAAERIEVSLALFPLVFREVKVDRLTLIRPVIDLRVDDDGRRSWDFAAGGQGRPPLQYAQIPGPRTDAGSTPPELADFMRNASPPKASSANENRLGLEAFSFADVRVEEGRIRYADRRSGFARELGGIDATLSLPSVGGPLSAKGHATLAGERIAIDLRLEQLGDFLADRSVPVRVNVEGNAVSASYDGKLTGGIQPLVDGRVALKASSAAKLARLLDLPLTGLDDLGALSVEGQMRATGASLMLTSATLMGGATAGTGLLGIEFGGERPRLVTNLRLSVVDLDQLSALTSAARVAPQASEPGSPGRFAAPVGPPAQPSLPPRSIGDLLEREDLAPQPSTNPATRVHGYRKRAGNQWETDAIEAHWLRDFDADARLQVAALRAGALEAGQLQAGVELKGGVLRLTLTDVQIAGGTVRGLASIDARKPSLVVGANLTGERLDLKQVMALTGTDVVDGRGRLVVAVSAEGGSERELISTLAGRAEVKIADGALIGWDADAIVAGVGKGQMPSSGRDPNARTPFKELSGNFNIAKGVARTRDLKLDSRTVTASGTGTINIVDRNIDLIVKPRIASGGIEIPIRVAGSWDNPSVVPDVNRALESPQAQEAVRHLKDGNVDGALRSVLGNGPKADKQIDKAKELLRGILGR